MPVTLPFIGAGYIANTDVCFEIIAENDAMFPIEIALKNAITSPILEPVRRHILGSVSNNLDANVQARTFTVLVYQTEIGALFNKIIFLPNEIANTRLCERRKYIEIDNSLKPYYSVYKDVKQEFLSKGVSEEFLNVIDTHLKSKHLNHRIAGLCSLVFLATIYNT